MTYPVVARGALALEVLIWIEAKHRETGTPQAMGLHTGLEDRAFVIDGDQRTYTGAGAVLEVADLVSQVGLGVQMQTAGLALVTDEVQQLIRGYDARQAPVEMHLARFDPETNALIEITRVFKGWLDEATLREGVKNGEASLSARLASSARALTRRVPLRRSDEAHRATHAGDRFFRYADVSGAVGVWWGMKRGGGKGGGQSFAEKLAGISSRLENRGGTADG
ncbi:hypothetical protein [Mameliella alba]|uniref:Uncharacterized protein n=1 Tax=Mameliella alba TaxID=561184 RepID=A0A0B3RWY8_9RHOB|nr:hypothetical protein [Mameliella alba]KHQ51258.1 hypothetical protein OA50_04291 [Mameliella alba]